MNKEEYMIIVSLIKNDGIFNVPPNERSRAQKSAYVKYWRLKEKLSLDSNDILLFEGKKVLKKDEIKMCVTKTFKQSKSAGYKKLRMRALDGYAGLSRSNILKITSNNADFKKFTIKFTNKAIPKPIIAKEVSEVHMK